MMKWMIHDYAGHPFPPELSRELARRGHGVIHAYAGGLLTPRGELKRKKTDPNGLEFVEIPMDKGYRANKYQFIKRRRMEIAYGYSLAEAIRTHGPDLVISGNTPTEPQWIALRECRRLGISFVSWIQDFYSIAVSKLANKKMGGLGRLVGMYYRRLERKTLRHCAGIVAITEDFLEPLRRWGIPDRRVVVIPNWAPLEEIPTGTKVNDWSLAHGLEAKHVFLYSGTLAMKHNPEMLRRLAKHFLADDEVNVVVISEGPGSEWLARRKQEEGMANLILLPFQEFSRMPEVLASADVLIAVLERDAGVFSVPSKVLTYHCAGRTVLAAMPGANLAARIIRKADSGICVEPDDTDGFIAAAEELKENNKFRDQCGRNARVYAEKNFDIREIGDRFEQFVMQEAGLY